MTWPILSIVVWLPIFGGIAVMLLGSERAPLAKQVALGTSIVTFVLSLPLWVHFDFDSAGMQFVESVRLDRALQRELRARRRRHLDAADPAHDVPHAVRRRRGLASHRDAAVAVLRRVPDSRRPHGRHVRRHRCAAVLRVLGSDARADVPHHRHMGRGAPRVRHREVLPLHVPGLRVHARGPHLYVPAGRRLRDRLVPRPAPHDERAGADLPRVPARVRRQGADVPRAHVAARRARRSADGRLRDPGRDPAEDGRLRLHPLQLGR